MQMQSAATSGRPRGVIKKPGPRYASSPMGSSAATIKADVHVLRSSSRSVVQRQTHPVSSQFGDHHGAVSTVIQHSDSWLRRGFLQAYAPLAPRLVPVACRRRPPHIYQPWRPVRRRQMRVPRGPMGPMSRSKCRATPTPPVRFVDFSCDRGRSPLQMTDPQHPCTLYLPPPQACPFLGETRDGADGPAPAVCRPS